MKTAVLIFAIWLSGALIAAYYCFKALRYKYDSTPIDYAVGCVCVLFSWLFLLAVCIGYLRDRLSAWRERMEERWQKLDNWWHSRK